MHRSICPAVRAAPVTRERQGYRAFPLRPFTHEAKESSTRGGALCKRVILTLPWQPSNVKLLRHLLDTRSRECFPWFSSALSIHCDRSIRSVSPRASSSSSDHLALHSFPRAGTRGGGRKREREFPGRKLLRVTCALLRVIDGPVRRAGVLDRATSKRATARRPADGVTSLFLVVCTLACGGGNAHDCKRVRRLGECKRIKSRSPSPLTRVLIAQGG